MKTLLRPSALIAGAVLLASCGMDRAEAPPFVVSVHWNGATCQLAVEGERVSFEGLSKVPRPANTKVAIIVGEREIPYKCVGGAIFALQSAGLRHVYFARWSGG